MKINLDPLIEKIRETVRAHALPNRPGAYTRLRSVNRRLMNMVVPMPPISVIQSAILNAIRHFGPRRWQNSRRFRIQKPDCSKRSRITRSIPQPTVSRRWSCSMRDRFILRSACSNIVIRNG